MAEKPKAVFLCDECKRLVDSVNPDFICLACIAKTEATLKAKSERARQRELDYQAFIAAQEALFKRVPRQKAGDDGVSRNIPEYVCWNNMIQRCYNRKNTVYKHYGGRGIRICREWRSFDAFYADMGDRPSPRHSLDRLDSNGNYEPSNCAWRTPVDQANNRRGNRHLAFQGRTLTVSQWARETGLSVYCIRYRVDQGWSVERALTTPKLERGKGGGRVKRTAKKYSKDNDGKE